MKILVNTAFDPHAMWVFDEQNRLVDELIVPVRKEFAAQAHTFLRRLAMDDCTWIGGFSGPGGFSSLRVAGGLLNALALTNNLPVHAVRVDEAVEQYLVENKREDEWFVLQSFGQQVLLGRAGQPLKPLPVGEAAKVVGEASVVGVGLPADKAEYFSNLELLHLQPEEWMDLFVSAEPREMFHAAYAFAPVQ